MTSPAARKAICCENIDGTSDFKNDVDDEDGGSEPDNFFIGGKPMEDRVSEYSKDGGEYNGDHDGFLHNIFTHEESGMRFLFSDEMPDANGTTLRHGDAEQIGKHDDIDTIGACGKSFDSQHIDEEGNHYLRRTVGKLFARRREGRFSSGSLALSMGTGGNRQRGSGGYVCETG